MSHTLYIANCSKQNFEFQFRNQKEPGSKVVSVTIPVGNQSKVVSNADSSKIDWIIKQHEIYGLKPVNEVDHRSGFNGICYQIDNPVDIDKILRGFDYLDKTMDDLAAEKRQIASAAIANKLAEGNRNFKGLELEIVEKAEEGE